MKQRKDGRWEQAVPIGRRPNNRIIYTHVCAQTKAELKEKVKERAALVDSGVNVQLEMPTVGQWAQKWLETEKSGKAVKTYKMYLQTIKNHILPTLGGWKLDKVRLSDLKSLVNRKSETMSRQTLHVLAITIKQIFRSALENGYISRSPADFLKVTSSAETMKREALTEEEIGILIDAVKDHPYRKLPMLLLFTGLRKGEALALMKTDIKLDFIDVNKSFDYSSNQPAVKSTKTRAGTRQVPIPIDLREYLADDTSDGMYVFEKFGRPLSHTSFRWIWHSIDKAYQAAAGNTKTVKKVKPITPHVLRHTYATILYERDIDIKTAQQWLGHSTFKMTMDIYTHLSKGKEQSAIEKLNGFLRSSATKHGIPF